MIEKDKWDINTEIKDLQQQIVQLNESNENVSKQLQRSESKNDKLSSINKQLTAKLQETKKDMNEKM